MFTYIKLRSVSYSLVPFSLSLLHMKIIFLWFLSWCYSQNLWYLDNRKGFLSIKHFSNLQAANLPELSSCICSHTINIIMSTRKAESQTLKVTRLWFLKLFLNTYLWARYNLHHLMYGWAGGTMWLLLLISISNVNVSGAHFPTPIRFSPVLSYYKIWLRALCGKGCCLVLLLLHVQHFMYFLKEVPGKKIIMKYLNCF